ncbi:MAG: MFS transporter [Candidatus Heimdallarchaeota archaeon]
MKLTRDELKDTTPKKDGKRLSMSLLNKRNITLISVGAFTWSLFFAIQGQFLNDYIADFGNYTPMKISLMISIVALTGAIISILAGSLSDNLRISFGRRKVFIILGGTLSALLVLLFPVSKTIAGIIALNIVIGILNTAAFVCNNSFIPDISEEENLGKTNAVAAIGTSFGTVAGFAIMLIPFSTIVFILTGILCAIGFIITGLFIQEPEVITPPKKWLEEIKNTFQLRNLKTEKNFFSFLISHFLLHTGISVYLPFLLIFLTQENNPQSGELIGLGLSIQNGQVLIVFTAMTFVALLATLPFGFYIDKTDTGIFLVISRVLFAVTTGILAITPLLKINPLIIGILFIIPFSISNSADIISRGAFMQQLAPGEKRGQFLGLTIFVKIIAQIPGVIIGGLIAQFSQSGYQYAFLVGGIILLLSVPFLIMDRLPIIKEQKEKNKLVAQAV